MNERMLWRSDIQEPMPRWQEWGFGLLLGFGVIVWNLFAVYGVLRWFRVF